MKLARFAGGAARVEGDMLVPFAGAVLDQAMRPDDPLPQSGPEVPLAGPRLLAPFDDPPSIRDFYAFERHVATARRLRGLDMHPDWYELPVFYFTNPATVYGPDDEIPYPRAASELDYELELAWVIGDPDGRIAGFTVFNDLSARDLQRREMQLNLGPSKGKDFASAFGPVLVTPDEWSGGTMVARVNGVEYSRGHTSEMHHTVEAMTAYAARDSRLRRGDVMGSGTVGTGCILEHAGRFPWLCPGDVVELEIDGIGVLRNTIAHASG